MSRITRVPLGCQPSIECVLERAVVGRVALDAAGLALLVLIVTFFAGNLFERSKGALFAVATGTRIRSGINRLNTERTCWAGDKVVVKHTRVGAVEAIFAFVALVNCIQTEGIRICTDWTVSNLGRSGNAVSTRLANVTVVVCNTGGTLTSRTCETVVARITIVRAISVYGEALLPALGASNALCLDSTLTEVAPFAHITKTSWDGVVLTGRGSSVSISNDTEGAW